MFVRIRWPFATCALVLAVSGGCVIDEVEDYDVGEARWCEGTTPWPGDYGELEDSMFERIVALRRGGRECGDDRFNPVFAPVVSPELRCAARVQATYLAEHDGIDHEGFDDTTPLTRAAFAGYRGALRYELVARDFAGPGAALAGWLEDADHCAALLDRGVGEIGVGHSRNAEGTKTGWVLLLGDAPAE